MTRQEWIDKCNHWKELWPVKNEQPVTDETSSINIYSVLDAINQHSESTDVLMGDAGSISYAGPVALNAKEGQRFVFSPAQADMGWALPASIGVALAGAKQVIAITGDGSFMCNMQELAVIKQHNLNIKLVILNNDGYLSIKNTQTKYFEGRVFGTGSETGLTFPDFKLLVESFGLPHVRISNINDLHKQLPAILSIQSPAVIEVICTPDQEILPAQALKDGKQCGLHDMTPFLSDDVLANEMIVDIK